MLEERAHNAPSRRDALLSVSMLCKERSTVGRRNEANIKKWQAELDKINSDIDILLKCFNHVTRIHKNIKEHDAQRKQVAFEMFNRSLYEVSKMIPDADLREMQLRVTETGRIKIVNEKGQELNLREGGAVRTTTGTLLRYLCILENNGAIPLMLFDESFFTLSDTTTVEFRRRIEELSKKCLIIIVEQRNNIADGIVDVEYQFLKGPDGITKVRCVDYRSKKNGS